MGIILTKDITTMRTLYLLSVVLLSAMVMSQAPVAKKKVLVCEKGTDNVYRVEPKEQRRLQAVQNYPMCVMQLKYEVTCDKVATRRRRMQSVVDMCEVDGYICDKNKTPTTKCPEIAAP